MFSCLNCQTKEICFDQGSCFLVLGIASMSPPAPDLPQFWAIEWAEGSRRLPTLHEADEEGQQGNDAEQQHFNERIESESETGVTDRDLISPARSVASESLCVAALIVLAAIMISLSDPIYLRTMSAKGRMLSIGLFISGNALVFVVLHAASHFGHR